MDDDFEDDWSEIERDRCTICNTDWRIMVSKDGMSVRVEGCLCTYRLLSRAYGPCLTELANKAKKRIEKAVKARLANSRTESGADNDVKERPCEIDKKKAI